MTWLLPEQLSALNELQAACTKLGTLPRQSPRDVKTRPKGIGPAL